MFEDAVFESTGRNHTSSYRWMMATFALNGSVLLTLVLIPLINPEALPHHALWMPLTAPPPPPPPPVLKEAPRLLQTTSEMPQLGRFAPPRISRPGATVEDASVADGPITIGLGTAVPDTATGFFANRRDVQVVPTAVKGPVRVSSGVMDGIVIRKTMPVYPAIAKAAGVQGAVSLQATISKNGMIENLRVVSGPAMLQQAAMDAVRQWRYKPFLLNGEPVEVQTTVNVVFSLGR